MTNHACHKHHLQGFAARYLAKAYCEMSVSSLRDFFNKVRRSAKKALIMHNYAN